MIPPFAATRNAIYLWSLLGAYCPVANVRWQPVFGGAAYCDEFLACNLGVAASTIRAWRRRLEAAGFIRTETIGRSRKFWMLNPSVPEPVAAERLETPLVVN